MEGLSFHEKSYKQTLIGTSTNHYDWLRRVINPIQVSSDIELIGSPTIIYKDNAACVAQMRSCYMKNNVTKHITPDFFYPHEL
jgi:hypothetical protein